MNKHSISAIQSALWSVALPGFGQLLNKKYFKGLLLIALEFIINIKASLNSVIILSFYGDINRAIQQTDYQWLMFYPCIYLFGIWDAYRDAIDQEAPFFFAPFVLAAYIGTIAVIYSPSIKLMGILLGPIFLPILFIIISLILGFALRWFILKSKNL